MQTHLSSAYSHFDDVVRQQPHHAARNFEALDALAKDVNQLRKDLKAPRTTEQRVLIKQEIFDALRKLDAVSPPILRRANSLPHTSAPAPKGSSEISALIDKVETAQTAYLYAQNEAERATAIAKANNALDILGEALTERRKLLQPKRPRIDPKRENVLADVNLHLYAPFARAMAASAEADRATPEGRRLLANAPHINHVAKEVQAFVAMLDLSSAVDSVLRECKRNHRNPHDFWEKNKKQLHLRLTQATVDFDRTIVPLHLTVTAGDPSLRTSEHYDAFIKAEQAILHAETYGGLKHAQETLKAHAFEFILGGADKDGGEVHHKLFTRIKEAYKADKKHVKKLESDYDQTHDTDRGQPFENPLTANKLYTMNRVYEARWALADDILSEILQRNKRTIANPNVAHPSAKPPTHEVTNVKRITRSSAKTTAAENTTGSRGHADAEEARRAKGATQRKLFD